MSRRRFMTNIGDLPSNYQKVKYIIFCIGNTIKINFNDITINNLIVYLNFNTINNGMGNVYQLNGTDRSFGLFPQGGALYCYYNGGNNRTSYSTNNAISRQLKNEYIENKANFYENNILKASISIATVPTILKYLTLCGVLMSDNIKFNDDFIIINNNIEILHLIPCYRKSDNKPGMYDVVNNVFYINQGTGEFTLGPNV